MRLSRLLFAARNRAKIKNLEFDIDKDFLFELWNNQNGKCCLSGVPLDITRGENGLPRWNCPSIDQIDAGKGYTKSNVRLVCYQINAGMQDYGFEHFLDLCHTIIEHNK